MHREALSNTPSDVRTCTITALDLTLKPRLEAGPCLLSFFVAVVSRLLVYLLEPLILHQQKGDKDDFLIQIELNE